MSVNKVFETKNFPFLIWFINKIYYSSYKLHFHTKSYILNIKEVMAFLLYYLVTFAKLVWKANCIFYNGSITEQIETN